VTVKSLRLVTALPCGPSKTGRAAHPEGGIGIGDVGTGPIAAEGRAPTKAMSWKSGWLNRPSLALFVARLMAILHVRCV